MTGMSCPAGLSRPWTEDNLQARLGLLELPVPVGPRIQAQSHWQAEAPGRVRDRDAGGRWHFTALLSLSSPVSQREAQVMLAAGVTCIPYRPETGSHPLRRQPPDGDGPPGHQKNAFVIFLN